MSKAKSKSSSNHQRGLGTGVHFQKSVLMMVGVLAAAVGTFLIFRALASYPAPTPTEPANGAKEPASSTFPILRWTSSPGTGGTSPTKFRVQVARETDPSFNDVPGLAVNVIVNCAGGACPNGPFYKPTGLTVGKYFWRVRVRQTTAAIDTSPWSVVRSFEITSAPPPPSPRPTTETRRLFNIADSGSRQIGYWSNGSIDTPDSNVQRVVFVVHGSSGTAQSYFDYARDSADHAGANSRTTTLVIAPQFYGDSGSGNLIKWSSDNWKDGGPSTVDPKLSSYAVLDQMVLRARATFTNLRDVVVTGHSAGGQLTNRYAAGTAVPSHATMANVAFRFAIANPSSYLYLNDRRYKSGTESFASLTSSERSNCSSYNTYKYGLATLNSYMNLAGAAAIPGRYQSRRVYYLLGDQDTDPNDSDIADGCQAQWQGHYPVRSGRFERGNRYYDHLKDHFGTIPSGHIKLVVPGVAHSGRCMIDSFQAQQALFGISGEHDCDS